MHPMSQARISSFAGYTTTLQLEFLKILAGVFKKVPFQWPDTWFACGQTTKPHWKSCVFEYTRVCVGRAIVMLRRKEWWPAFIFKMCSKWNDLEHWRSSTKFYHVTCVRVQASSIRPYESVLLQCLCALMDECLGEGMLCWCCEEQDGGVSHANWVNW